MTTSTYMPDVVVEIAFTSGWAVADADRTWVDVSEWVDLEQSIGISFGRADELAQADANTLSVTLDNSDGRSTPDRPGSPYYPNVKIGRPIRVTATPPGQAPSVRFVGYIDEWPVEWEGSDGYARVTINATSRTARLGATDPLLSVVEEEVLRRAPIAYYTMGDPAGSTAAQDSSGHQGDPFPVVGTGRPVFFGTAIGPGTDGMTAATLDGTVDDFPNYGRHFARPLGETLTSLSVVVAFAAVTQVGSYEVLIDFDNQDGVANDPLLVSISSFDNALRLSSTGSPDVVSSTVVTGGSIHVAGLAVTGSVATLYLDGAAVGSTPVPASFASDLIFRIGGDSPQFGHTLTGVVAHVGLFDQALTAADMADISDSMLNGFDDETSDAWIEHLADWAGIPTAERSIEAGSTPIGAIETTGSSVSELLQQVTTAEQGTLFDGRDGALTFHNRSHRYQPAAAFTLDMAMHEVEADFSPKLDRSTLINVAEVTNTTGTTARVLDQASKDEYGASAKQIETVSSRALDVTEIAVWTVAVYAEPRPRVPTLSVDVLALDPAQAVTILEATLGTLVTVTNQPDQAAAAEASYFIEGATETIGPESYSITFNVSPSFPYDSIFIVDSSVIDGPDLIAI